MNVLLALLWMTGSLPRLVSACGSHDGHHHNHYHDDGVHNNDEDHFDDEGRSRRLNVHHGTCGAALSHEDERKMAESYLAWEEQNHGRRLDVVTYDVPVYFHVLKPDSATGQLSAQHRTELMTRLNRGFSGTAFSFHDAGMTEHVNSDWAICNNQGTFKQQTRVVGSDV